MWKRALWFRHYERSEAISKRRERNARLLRFARNDKVVVHSYSIAASDRMARLPALFNRVNKKHIFLCHLRKAIKAPGAPAMAGFHVDLKQQCVFVGF